MKYFISYSWTSKKQTGNGNIEIEVKKGMKSVEDTKNIAQLIKDRFDYEAVTVLYWKRFEC